MSAAKLERGEKRKRDGQKLYGSVLRDCFAEFREGHEPQVKVEVVFQKFSEYYPLSLSGVLSMALWNYKGRRELNSLNLDFSELPASALNRDEVADVIAEMPAIPQGNKLISFNFDQVKTWLADDPDFFKDITVADAGINTIHLRNNREKIKVSPQEWGKVIMKFLKTLAPQVTSFIISKHALPDSLNLNQYFGESLTDDSKVYNINIDIPKFRKYLGLTSLLMGAHPRTGARSPLLVATRSTLYEPKVYLLIAKLAGLKCKSMLFSSSQSSATQSDEPVASITTASKIN